MARIDTLGNFLTDVATAIREKKGTTETIQASNFDTEIASIETSSNITSSDITATYYSVDEGVAGSTSTSGLNIILNSEEIPDYAFNYTNTSLRYGNSWIKSVHIGNKAKKVGKRAFFDGPAYTVDENNAITEIGEYAFSTRYGDGDPETVTFPLLEKLPKNGFYYSKIKNIYCPKLTYIGESCFSNCVNLSSFEFTNLTFIAQKSFYNCTSLKKVSIPSLNNDLSSSAYFANCTGLVQFSCSLSGQFGHNNANSNAPLYKCTSLKAIWIHSNRTTFNSYTLGNNALYYCSGLKRIYIDYPRATVEGHSAYATLWSDNTVPEDCIVICNDDEGWMTQEEFDAIDWATEPQEEASA